MKKINCILFAALTIFSWACRKDFIVEDISDKTITVNAPANNITTTVNLITFWWDPLDGAEKYTLQIVKPDFKNAAQLLLDTNTTQNKFNFTLTPGDYQWRVKAINAGHSTTFQTYTLKVDTSSNLSEQTVNLLSPVNNAITSNTLITFSWGAVYSAKKYRLIINNALLVLDTLLTEKTSLTYSLLAVQNNTTSFTWNVKAINDNSESPFNATSYTLTIDKKGPTVPSLQSPATNSIITAQDSLKWSRGSEAVYDSAYVAEDSLFQGALQQIGVNVNRIAVSEFSLAPSLPGTFYWWRVRSFDAFGNPSPYSQYRKFKIAP